MFPLKDDNPTGRFPVLTVMLITVNVFVFLFELTVPREQIDLLMGSVGLVPARLTAGHGGAFLTLISSQFLHGGFLHLGGNMLYLWIFGNNIEDHLGRVRFLPFYLGCGVVAGLIQSLANPGSQVPTIGASGAIAGVLGAYAILFPRARVHTLVILLIFIRIVPVPAAVWLGIWFAIQLFAAAGSREVHGGIAWWAHLGGFAAGFLLVRVIAPKRKAAPPGLFGYRSWVH